MPLNVNFVYSISLDLTTNTHTKNDQSKNNHISLDH